MNWVRDVWKWWHETLLFFSSFFFFFFFFLSINNGWQKDPVLHGVSFFFSWVVAGLSSWRWTDIIWTFITRSSVFITSSSSVDFFLILSSFAWTN